MSRIANSPVNVPSGVEVKLDGQDLSVKGSKGALQMTIHSGVEVTQEDNTLTFAAKDSGSVAMSGTTRALVNNMVVGVSDGFEKKRGGDPRNLGGPLLLAVLGLLAIGRRRA